MFIRNQKSDLLIEHYTLHKEH